MRFLLFITVGCIGLFAPAWFFFLCAAGYALWRTPYELIVLGIFFDAQFGIATTSFPFIYTATLGTITIGVELIKPYLVFYRV